MQKCDFFFFQCFWSRNKCFWPVGELPRNQSTFSLCSPTVHLKMSANALSPGQLSPCEVMDGTETPSNQVVIPVVRTLFDLKTVVLWSISLLAPAGALLEVDQPRTTRLLVTDRHWCQPVRRGSGSSTATSDNKQAEHTFSDRNEGTTLDCRTSEGPATSGFLLNS